MSTDYTLHTEASPKLASLAAVLSVVVGAMVLVGWTFDIATLKSVLPGWVTMKANTAVGFILTGIALWLTARPPATFNPQLLTFFFGLARLCGLLVGLIGLLTLGEYLFDWNPGIDQWLFREPAGAVGTSDPGRMAPETALCFVLLAAALWITGGLRKTHWTTLASVSLGLLVTTLALAAMLSYATPGLGPYGWFGLTIMAMHTSILFAMLGVAVILISWQQDVLQWSLSRNTTAAFACGMAVLVLVGFNTNRSQFWLAETNRKIAFSEEVLADINGIETEIIDLQVNTINYALAGDERFLKFYLESIADYNKKMNALHQLIAGSPHQQQQISLIETKANLLLRWSQQFIDTPRTGMTNAGRSKMAGDGEDLQDNLRATIKQIENEHRQLIQQFKQESESVSRLSYLFISTGTLASLLIFLIVISNLNLSVHKRKRAEEEIEFKNTILQTQQETTLDAILVVDENSQIISYNQQFIDLWRLSPQLVSARLDAPVLQSVVEQVENPEAFVARVQYLYAHRDDKSREEVQLKDGRIVDRYSAPVIGADGKYYGRVWYFRDITENKLAAQALAESERRFRAILDAAVDGISVMDAQSHLIAMGNRAFCDMLGYPMEEIYRVSIEDLHPREALAEVQRQFERNAKGEIRVARDLPMKRKDGSVFFVDISAAPMVYAGRPSLVGIFHDVTERKRAEESLKNMAAKFHTVFELSADAIMLLDEKGFFDCNDATLRMFGCSTRDDFISKHPAELSPPTQPGGEDSMSLANEHIATAVKNGNNLFEWMHRRLDGTDFPAEVLLTALELDGKPVLQATVRDITERKRADARLAEQLEELRRWHDVTSGREGRVLDLKHEVNELLSQTGKYPRYPSAESQDKKEE
jgi:PAS domain S-box-containing protein